MTSRDVLNGDTDHIPSFVMGQVYQTSPPSSKSKRKIGPASSIALKSLRGERFIGDRGLGLSILSIGTSCILMEFGCAMPPENYAPRAMTDCPDVECPISVIDGVESLPGRTFYAFPRIPSMSFLLSGVEQGIPYKLPTLHSLLATNSLGSLVGSSCRRRSR